MEEEFSDMKNPFIVPFLSNLVKSYTEGVWHNDAISAILKENIHIPTPYMRTSHYTSHQLFAFAIIAFSASTAGIAIINQLNAAAMPANAELRNKSDGNSEQGNAKDNRCLHRVYTCPEGLTPDSGLCTMTFNPVLCDSQYCKADSNNCFRFGSQYENVKDDDKLRKANDNQDDDEDTEKDNKITDSNECVHSTFTCLDNSNAPNCFKRVRNEEVKCNDEICADGKCITLSTFLSSTTFTPWDKGNLPGPFPRQETMCSIIKSSCPPEDTSCLSDVSVEQIDCMDPRCTNGECSTTTVQVDEKDNMIANINPAVKPADISSKKSDQSGKNKESDNSGQGNKKVEGIPFRIDFPTFQDKSAQNKNPKNTTQYQELGCFRKDGTWSRERSDQCDSNQLKYIQIQERRQTLTPPAQEIEGSPIFNQAHEADVRAKIEEKFLSKDKRDAQKDALLRTTDDAIARLGYIAEQGIVPIEASMHLTETLDWLRQVQVNFSAGEHSVDDIQQEASELRERLSSTQWLIASSLEQSGVSMQRKPETILSKTDRIFTAIPSAFSIMQDAQIEIPGEALQLFMDAREKYDVIKPECQVDTEKCLRISEVVAVLEPMITLMKDSISAAGRPDIEDQINLIFQ